MGAIPAEEDTSRPRTGRNKYFWPRKNISETRDSDAQKIRNKKGEILHYMDQ